MFKNKLIPPKSELLTQEQVNELPDGTRVMVLWSGGNGPYEYEICSHYNAKYVKDDYTDKPSHELGFVGKEPPFTLVWLKE